MNTIYKCRKCGTEIEISALVFELKQEIERLRAELNRVAVAVIAWDVSGRHRHCSCPSCEIICEIADNLKAAARAAEGGGDE